MDDIEDVDDDAVFEMTPTRPQRLPDSDPDADSNNGDENQGENARRWGIFFLNTNYIARFIYFN